MDTQKNRRMKSDFREQKVAVRRLAKTIPVNIES